MPWKMISPAEYIEQRLSDQIGWYDRKSSTNQCWFKWLRFTEIVAAATIPFLSGFAGDSFPIKIAILVQRVEALLSKESSKWVQSMMKPLERESRA